MNFQASPLTRFDDAAQVSDAFRRLRLRDLGANLIAFTFDGPKGCTEQTSLRFTIAKEQPKSDRVMITAEYAFSRTDGLRVSCAQDIGFKCTGEIEAGGVKSEMKLIGN